MYPLRWRHKFWVLPLYIGFDDVTLGEIAVWLGEIPSSPSISSYFLNFLNLRACRRGGVLQPVGYVEGNFCPTAHVQEYFASVSECFLSTGFRNKTPKSMCDLVSAQSLFSFTNLSPNLSNSTTLTLAIFFDSTKAFDTMWRTKIIQQLSQWHIILQFLSSCHIQVHI